MIDPCCQAFCLTLIAMLIGKLIVAASRHSYAGIATTLCHRLPVTARVAATEDDAERQRTRRILPAIDKQGTQKNKFGTTKRRREGVQSMRLRMGGVERKFFCPGSHPRDYLPKNAADTASDPGWTPVRSERKAKWKGTHGTNMDKHHRAAIALRDARILAEEFQPWGTIRLAPTRRRHALDGRLSGTATTPTSKIVKKSSPEMSNEFVKNSWIDTAKIIFWSRGRNQSV